MGRRRVEWCMVVVDGWRGGSDAAAVAWTPPTAVRLINQSSDEDRFVAVAVRAGMAGSRTHVELAMWTCKLPVD